MNLRGDHSAEKSRGRCVLQRPRLVRRIWIGMIPQWRIVNKTFAEMLEKLGYDIRIVYIGKGKTHDRQLCVRFMGYIMW